MAPLDWLVKINDFLETVPGNVIKSFNYISKMAEELGQSYVDIWCRWMAWKVNLMIERLRQRIIRTLHEQYGYVLELMQGVSLVQNALADPVGAITGFLDKFAKPIKTILSIITTLMTEIPRLAANLAAIAAALPPAPPNPSINYDAFQIQIGSISIGDVIGGPGAMKSPEEMFPEPTRPFSKAAFDESFRTAKKNTEGDKVVWKLEKTKEQEKIAEASLKDQAKELASAVGDFTGAEGNIISELGGFV